MPNLPWTHNTLASVTLSGTAQGVAVVNVFHMEASGTLEAGFSDDAAVQTALSAALAIFNTATKAPWVNAHPGEYTYVKAAMQCLERPGNFRHRLTPVELNQTAPNTGDGTKGVSETPTTAAVVKWVTPIAGKSHRGRTYFGPIGANQSLDGRLTTLGTTDMTNWVNAFMGLWGPTGTGAANWRWTIYSRPYNEGEYQYATRKTGTLTVVTPPDYAGNSTNITGTSVDNILRVQRRREIGVGS
jgi:hypothetical protein